MIEEKYLKEFTGNPGIDQDLLKALHLPKRLPSDYIELLNSFNGGEGYIGEEYLVLEKAEKLLEVNRDVAIEEFAKNIFIIGGNGGGEVIAIDFRSEYPKYIIMPYIFEYEAIITLGTTIEEFFLRIYEEGYFGNE